MLGSIKYWLQFAYRYLLADPKISWKWKLWFTLWLCTITICIHIDMFTLLNNAHDLRKELEEKANCRYSLERQIIDVTIGISNGISKDWKLFRLFFSLSLDKVGDFCCFCLLSYERFENVHLTLLLNNWHVLIYLCYCNVSVILNFIKHLCLEDGSFLVLSHSDIPNQNRTVVDENFRLNLKFGFLSSHPNIESMAINYLSSVLFNALPMRFYEKNTLFTHSFTGIFT